MALTPPDITTYTGVTTHQAMINAMITHFTSVSTKFSIIDSNASANILITPVAGGEVWDMRLVCPPGTIRISIDPLGGRTDSSLSTGSAQLSPLSTDMLSQYNGLNGKFTFVEFPDALFMLVSSADDASYSSGIHAGRILNPIYDTDLANGNTGLGMIGNRPHIQTTGNGSGWFTTNYSTHLTQNSPFQWFQEGLTTASWRIHTTAASYAIKNPTKAQCTAGGTIQPVPIFAGRWRYFRPTFVYKYVWTWWETNTPKTRITDGTGVRFMHVFYGNVLESMVIPWDLTSIP